MSVSSGVADGFGWLLEREIELARIDRVFDDVAAGAGAVVVVEGPAGIGKSALVAAARAGAHARSFGVLGALASEFEEAIAFGVARQIFEPMLHAVSPAGRRRLLDGVARMGARALGLGAEAGEAPDRFAAIHGLYRLSANRAEHGRLVVFVDDVQRVDEPSLAWLGYLGRRLSDLPVVLVLGLRSGDTGGERAELAQLVGGAERITLAPLSAVAVGALVRGQLDESAEESFCATVSELSGGNPLFVRELLAAARAKGLPARDSSMSALGLIAPAALGTSVLARLARLGPGSVALARAVAVLGAGAEVVLAARLAGLDPVVAELTADRLAAAQILAPARPLEFFHPIIGAAVREDIAPGSRRVAHRRAAELVDREGGCELARVAAHLLACGPAGDRWVVDRLCAAAHDALARGAPEIAASYVRRALSEPPPPDERAPLLLLLGTAEWRDGQPDAVAHLEQAIDASGDDVGTLVAACGLLALAYVVSGRLESALDVLDRSSAAVADGNAAQAITGRLSVIQPGLPEATALGGQAVIALVGMMDERTAPHALRHAQALHRLLPTLAEPPVYLLLTSACYLLRENRGTEARELLEWTLACEPYPPPFSICPLLLASLSLLECYDAVHRLCEDLLAAARKRGAVQETIGILVWRVGALYDCGALVDAEADARWVLERADEAFDFRTLATLGLIGVLVERDELAAAEDLLRDCVDPLTTTSALVPWLLLVRGRLRAAQGHFRAALGDFLESGQRCVRLGAVNQSTVPWRLEATLAHAALGDRDKAQRLATEQLHLARAFGRPRTLGMSLRAAGLAQGGETGLELLGQAVETLECSQSQLELARALSDHGAALRRAGRRVQARGELERALDLAHRCGARRVANQTRTELFALGAKPRRDAITGRDALTAGELRVARLAADGLTNREIAQALFITTNTAKAHLGRVYRKLGITRRSQLAAALGGVLTEAHEHSAALTGSRVRRSRARRVAGGVSG